MGLLEGCSMQDIGGPINKAPVLTHACQLDRVTPDLNFPFSNDGIADFLTQAKSRVSNDQTCFGEGSDQCSIQAPSISQKVLNTSTMSANDRPSGLK